jgi:pimeloyl-ACP methyl ester carboxylesterase
VCDHRAIVRAPFRQLPIADVPELPRLPHRYAETRADTVIVTTPHFGRVATHVRIHGAGPPLLLVHGFMTTSYSWRYVLDLLGTHFTLYIPDLVGCGASEKPDVAYTPDALARYIVALVDAIGIRGCAAIGNSMGGYLCMKAALADTSVFSRLVNLHSPGIPTARMRALRVALAMVPGWHSVLSWMVRRDPERWVHRNVHYFDETLKSREEHRAYAGPLAKPEGLNAFARYLDEALDVREMARFERSLAARGPFPIPLMLIYARRDPMVPPVVGERLKALVPNAEFVWLEDASHFAHVDATSRFVTAITPFLAR